MNLRFIVRGFLLAIPLAALVIAIWIYFQIPHLRLLAPIPPAPTILAPCGEMPTGTVSFQEWTGYRGQGYTLSGSGFLLRLENKVVGVTTAHGTSLGQPDHPLERIALGVAGQSDFIGEFDTLQGPRGRLFTLDDMTLDYTLLQISQPQPPELVLAPDPRSAPQPGERVTLFSGVDGRSLEGTVQSVTDTAIWVRMDEVFNPSLMSGSPFVSQHTGQVVGMAVAASSWGKRLYLGMNPIGAIVQHAESATEFPRIIELSQ